jgi:hypothetical protein
MKQKRYVLIEYTDDVIDGPPCNWPEILTGVVNVGNWIDLTQDKVEAFYFAAAVDDVFYDTGKLSAKEVKVALEVAEEGDDEVPNCLSICEQYDFDLRAGSASNLLAMLEEIAKSMELDLINLLQLDWSAD